MSQPLGNMLERSYKWRVLCHCHRKEWKGKEVQRSELHSVALLPS